MALVRPEGFEPPAFWSVALIYAFHRFLYLSTNPDFARVCGFLLFISYYIFSRFFETLCAKCALNGRKGSDGVAIVQYVEFSPKYFQYGYGAKWLKF